MTVAPEDHARASALHRWALRKIGRARVDPSVFFELVMREETTQARLKTLPHQRVLFAFVMRYPRCVVRMPVGSSKTYCMTALTMFLLGQDPTARGAIVSATQGQAQKPLALVRDYLEGNATGSAALRSVFPELKPSERDADKWTQTRLVVERPPGIRDPSLVAVGVDGALPGSRLSWILVDDVLDDENSATEEARERVRRWFATMVLSRRDVRGARVVVTNTPWHPADLTYKLEATGWPTLTMDIEGGITITNADAFDTDDLRPSVSSDEQLRLVAHDDPELLAASYPDDQVPELDTDDRVSLWPGKFPRAVIAQLREDYSIAEFNQLFMCICRDDDSARVKLEWIDRCKRAGHDAGHVGLVTEYAGQGATFTGVDLGVGRTTRADLTAFFTFAVQPDKKRLILDVEYGRFGGREIVAKLIEKHQRYNSIVRVENNAAQDFLLQWARDVDYSLPLRAHTTGKNKADPAHGVESLFIEVEKALWLIPSTASGSVHPAIQRWISDMYYYVPPPAHTGDVLMAAWLAREQARASGALVKRDASIGLAGIMSR